jgi:hypothetical protein
MDVISTHRCAPWVRDAYLRKFELFISSGISPEDGSWNRSINFELFKRTADILERIPEGPALVRNHLATIKPMRETSPDPVRGEYDRLLKLAEKE